MNPRLRSATSPYLRQHADNPVDWYPWGDEPFEIAAERDIPVFISIGYAACHWCHVMAHESFEDLEVADVLNQVFVNIKVDREEHPTVDHFYMSACTAMGQRGGWPLTIIALPSREPVFCGTYMPKRSRHGRLGLVDLAERFSEVWEKDRSQIESYASELVAALRKESSSSVSVPIGREPLDRTFDALSSRYDRDRSGFGDAPKFPTAHQLSFLLRYDALVDNSDAKEMAYGTLRAIRRGGIFDQIGLGVHRYSTDREWKLPHFEKMLVDQAMLAVACIEAFQVSADHEFAAMATDLINYVLRDLRNKEGAFFASEDADSEGSEGKFYLWSWTELSDVLTEDELDFSRREWNIDPEGNIEDEATGDSTGLNLFFGADPYPADDNRDTWQNIRQKLLDTRSTRIRPERDEKILTDWNGAMIAALAIAGRVLQRPEWIDAATAATEQLLAIHRSDEALFHSSFEGVVSERGSLDDFAFLSWGILALFESTGDARWLNEACGLCDQMIDRFWDPDSNAFYLTPSNSPDLPVRQKQNHDGATPAGSSIAASVLLLLAPILDDQQFEEIGRAQLMSSLAVSSAYVIGFSSVLSAATLVLKPRREVVVVSGDGSSGLLNRVNRSFLPTAITVPVDGDTIHALHQRLPHLVEYKAVDGKETVYLCSDRVCDFPITDPAELELQLKN